MAILAKAEITISKIADIKKVTTYYLLQSSTLAAPSKPADGAAIDSSWSKTEPSYTSGSTKTLYTVVQTTLSDGNITYSEVSKSSSYEAAKEAWNKANNAQNSATNANNKIDSLKVGGRNLFVNASGFTKDNPYRVKSARDDTGIDLFDGKVIYAADSFKAGDIITVSVESEQYWSTHHGATEETHGKVGVFLLVFLCHMQVALLYLEVLSCSREPGSWGVSGFANILLRLSAK